MKANREFIDSVCNVLLLVGAGLCVVGLLGQTPSVRLAWNPGDTNTAGYYVMVGTNLYDLRTNQSVAISIIAYDGQGHWSDPAQLSTNAIMFDVWMEQAQSLGLPWTKFVKLSSVQLTNSGFYRIVMERR